MPSLLDRVTHNRWKEKLIGASYHFTKPGQQCFSCWYYVELNSPLGNDWGVCTSSFSDYDGMVRYEHDGCDEYVPDTRVAASPPATPPLGEPS